MSDPMADKFDVHGDRKREEQRQFEEGEVYRAIDTLQGICHTIAVSKGWWEEIPERNFPEQIALMHSELSEALEDYRNFGMKQTVAYDGRSNSHLAKEPGYLFYEGPDGDPYAIAKDSAEVLLKPLGIASELADVLVRIFDTCGRYQIPLAQALREKIAYNRTRPYRHGGKKA